MARFWFLAVFGIVSVVLLQQAFALKCWHCDGEKDPNCNDPFHGDKLDQETLYVDCLPATPNGPVACTKATIEMDGKINVQRKCANKKEAIEQGCTEEAIKQGEAVLKAVTGKDVKLQCEQPCFTDGCNGKS